MKKFRLLLFFVLLHATMLMAAPVTKSPTVFILDANTLQKNKLRIEKRDKEIMPAYQLLLKDADKALTWGPHSVMEKKNNPPSGDMHDYMSLAPYFWPDPTKPDGLPYIRKDGQTNPEVKDYSDKDYMPKLCEHVQVLSLAYYFSGNEKYAEHAAKLLRVWFLNKETKMNPNLNYAQAIKGFNEGRGAGLIDTRHFVKVVDAIGLIQSSSHWKTTDQKGMQQWFADFLHWMQTSKIGIDEMNAENNHGIWYDVQRLSYSLFIDSTGLAKKIIANAALRLDKQMDNTGSFPKEMERTIALHYSVFALQAFFHVATMAEKTGIDMWQLTTPSGKSLKKGFDFQKPYITNEKPWTGQQIKPYEWEESYPLLLTAAQKYKCTDCTASVNKMAGDEKDRLIETLLY